MQQRKSALGRPSGTDGSDFSYRMVVDSRYQRVAQGKSRLSALILIQAVIQMIGVLFAFLWKSGSDSPNTVFISTVAVGFISLIIGELGRRRSRASLLKVYMFLSSMATFLTIAYVAKGNLTLEVIKYPSDWGAEKFELLMIARTLLEFFIQIFAIKTTSSLIHNMSPPKRAS